MPGIYSALRSRSSTSRARRAVLHVEHLEDRTVPSASLVGFNTNSGDWKVAESNGGQFEISTIGHWDPYGLTSVQHGDFDGDGDTDVAGWGLNGYWLVGRTGPDRQIQTEIWLSDWGTAWTWKTMQVGDFDADGMDDIAMYSTAGAWWVCRSTGASFEVSKWSQFGTTSGWTTQVVGDFNQDGRSDIANYYAPNAEWWVSLSTGVGFVHSNWSTFGTKSGWTLQVVGDFNGDGASDIANFYEPNGEWWISQSDGAAFHASKWVTVGPTGGFSSPVVYDFNGDARPDIATLDHGGRTWVFLSDGMLFAPMRGAVNPMASDPATRLQAGDFDGNGQAELAIFTRNGTWLVGAFNGNAVAYSWYGDFGAGNWISTFSDQPGRRNENVSQSGVLRANSALYFVSPEDVARLRIDPSYFATIFDSYKYRMRARLGPEFHDINDQAVAYSLATLVAYEAAPYRGAGDPEGFFPAPASFTLVDLLNTKKLVCNEYDFLATALYRVAFPIAEDPDSTIYMIGFSKGPFGNHSQIIFTSGGVTLLCDPNLGLVARTSLEDLFAGVRVANANIRQIVYRVESTPYMEFALSRFRAAVYGALANGLYPRATFIYSTDLTNNEW